MQIRNQHVFFTCQINLAKELNADRMRRTMWLPRCRATINPKRCKARTTSAPETTGRLRMRRDNVPYLSINSFNAVMASWESHSLAPGIRETIVPVLSMMKVVGMDWVM